MNGTKTIKIIAAYFKIETATIELKYLNCERENDVAINVYASNKNEF